MAVAKLTISYNGVFNHLKNTNDETLLKQEQKETVSKIYNNSDYMIGNQPGVLCKNAFFAKPENIEFTFLGSFDSLCEDDEIINFICAHEIKHAMLNAEAIEGKNNISTLRNLTQVPEILAHKNAEKYDETFDVIEELAKEDYSLLSGYAYLGMQDQATGYCLNSIAWYALGKVIKPVPNFLQRIEERQCDAFAFRAYPETDINDFHDFLKKNDRSPYDPLPVEKDASLGNKILTKTINFVMNAAEMVEYSLYTHPSPEERLNNLTKQKSSFKKT